MKRVATIGDHAWRRGNPSPELDAGYGGGFIEADDFVGFIFRSLPWSSRRTMIRHERTQ